MKPTHQRRSRKAECFQFKGHNYDVIAPLFESASLYGTDTIMLRKHQGGIKCLSIGDWVVIGEDGKVRTYKDNEFNLMYEVIP